MIWRLRSRNSDELRIPGAVCEVEETPGVAASGGSANVTNIGLLGDCCRDGKPTRKKTRGQWWTLVLAFPSSCGHNDEIKGDERLNQRAKKLKQQIERLSETNDQMSVNTQPAKRRGVLGLITLLPKSTTYCSGMAFSPPTVIVLAHPFIRQLRHDLRPKFHPRADETFGLATNAIVHLHGVGGLNVAKLCHGLHVVSSFGPDVILKMVTNDLADLCSDVSASEIEGHVRLFLNSYSVRVIGICEFIPRVRAAFFNAAASTLNHNLLGVFKPFLDQVVQVKRRFSCWGRKGRLYDKKDKTAGAWTRRRFVSRPPAMGTIVNFFRGGGWSF